MDGSCTGRKFASWAQTLRAQFTYFDDLDSTNPTTGLPSARLISNEVSEQTGSVPNSHGLNELFTFFGQFIDHNLVATTENEEEPTTIPIPEDDPVFNEPFPFLRSVRVQVPGTSFERPINVLSSTLDLSAVYGANPTRFDLLRESNSCRMKTSSGNNLPLNEFGLSNAPTTSNKFFVAGDHRANEHPVLTSLHTIFLREHNRLCEKIENRLPFFSSRRMFDVARKINIAQFQKIVYEEFYPAIINAPLPKYRGFKSMVDPTVSVVFSTAGFRVGHTLVGNVVSRIDQSGTTLPGIPMMDMFFRPASALQPGDIEDFVRGAGGTLAQEVDNKVVDALRNFLFTNVEGQEGMDLVSLNIQRSRDHAVPSYNQVRQKFTGTTAATFADISSDTIVQGQLMAAYGEVNKVEAWPGMISEDRTEGGLGKTMANVWRDEFVRLRDGDQFFYRRQNRIPRIVRRRLRKCVRDIWRRRRRIFRDIIVRNTDITADQLPSADIFKK